MRGFYSRSVVQLFLLIFVKNHNKGFNICGILGWNALCDTDSFMKLFEFTQFSQNRSDLSVSHSCPEIMGMGSAIKLCGKWFMGKVH